MSWADLSSVLNVHWASPQSETIVNITHQVHLDTFLIGHHPQSTSLTTCQLLHIISQSDSQFIRSAYKRNPHSAAPLPVSLR
jgi:hypothetical protein